MTLFEILTCGKRFVLLNPKINAYQTLKSNVKGIPLFGNEVLVHTCVFQGQRTFHERMSVDRKEFDNCGRRASRNSMATETSVVDSILRKEFYRFPLLSWTTR